MPQRQCFGPKHRRQHRQCRRRSGPTPRRRPRVPQRVAQRLGGRRRRMSARTIVTGAQGPHPDRRSDVSSPPTRTRVGLGARRTPPAAGLTGRVRASGGRIVADDGSAKGEPIPPLALPAVDAVNLRTSRSEASESGSLSQCTTAGQMPNNTTAGRVVAWDRRWDIPAGPCRS